MSIVKRWTTEAGLEAIILLVDDSHHCGYVVAPTKLVGLDYYDPQIGDLDVHGGITFAEELSELDNKWVFGYDCAHHLDKSRYNPHGTWREEDFCIEECESLAKQLKLLGDK